MPVSCDQSCTSGAQAAGFVGRPAAGYPGFSLQLRLAGWSSDGYTTANLDPQPGPLTNCAAAHQSGNCSANRPSSGAYNCIANLPSSEPGNCDR